MWLNGFFFLVALLNERPVVSIQTHGSKLNSASNGGDNVFSRHVHNAKYFSKFLGHGYQAVPPMQGEVSAVSHGESYVPAERQGMHFRPVSVTLWCVMGLTIQSLVVYTTLAMSRNTDELMGECEPSLFTQTLVVATRSVSYAPMLCMLFVACRMYVLAATNGLGEPPWWVKGCMIASSCGVTLQLLVTLTLPFFFVKGPTKDQQNEVRFDLLAGENCDVHVFMDALMFDSARRRRTFSGLQGLAVFLIYSGVIGVIFGIFSDTGHTDVSVAVVCTAGLSALYFMMFFVLWLGSARGEDAYVVRAASRQAALSVKKAPMLAVLFLASRMRALQIDPPHGMPPQTVQQAFLAISWALLLETVVAFAIGTKFDDPMVDEGEQNDMSSKVLNFLQHVFAFIVYGGLAPLVYEIVRTGPPLTSATSVVLLFCAMYFSVQVVQLVVSVMQDVCGLRCHSSQSIVSAADAAVKLCPLLSILCVACRMRALQITQQQGAPPTWAQQAMFMTLYAMMVQVTSCVVLSVFSGKTVGADDDGMASWDARPLLVAYAVTLLKYIALFCMHGGVLMVCTAVFVMTPETARSHDDGIMSRETLGYCITVTIVALIFAVAFSGAKVLGIIFKLAIESLDTQYLGLEITVRMAAFNLFNGWVSLADVLVENPAHPMMGGDSWSSPYLMKVKRCYIDLDTWQLIKSGFKVFEFEQIILKDVDVNYEKPWKMKDNVTCVMDHLSSQQAKPAAATSDAGDGKTPPANGQGKATQVVFHKIVAEGLSASAYVSGPSGLGGQVKLVLADLVFPDFTQQAQNPDDVHKEFVRFVIQTLMETVLANIGPGKQMKNVMKVASDRVRSCLKGITPSCMTKNSSFGKPVADA